LGNTSPPIWYRWRVSSIFPVCRAVSICVSHKRSLTYLLGRRIRTYCKLWPSGGEHRWPNLCRASRRGWGHSQCKRGITWDDSQVHSHKAPYEWTYLKLCHTYIQTYIHTYAYACPSWRKNSVQ
jgi:hypothetical protein